MNRYSLASFAALLLLSVAVPASALTVTMKTNVEGGDRPTIIGTTNLPDGITLMVTVSRKASRYSAQSKVEVKGGVFRAGPFSQKEAALNPGSYELSVTTPLASFQPPHTWPVIGNEGARLQGPLVKKSKFGGKVVEYRTSFAVAGGKADAAKDRAARVQDAKDMHEWWLRSCKNNCDTVRGLAVQRREPFDWDRCYYKCVAEEPARK